MHPSQQEFLEASDNSTDKVSHHGYHRFYPWFLSEFRGKPVHVLEIGLDQLGSVRLWNRYFPEGLHLHGIDRDKKQSDAGNIIFHRADQGNPADLESFTATVGTSFNVILDDGSHVPDHQLLSLKILWKNLQPGGIYILEDIETSYWGRSNLYNYDFDSSVASRNTVLQLLGAIDAINGEFLRDEKRRQLEVHQLAEVLGDIEMISFGHNCIILLKKDPDSFRKYYNREYRFKGRITSSLSSEDTGENYWLEQQITALKKEVSNLKMERDTLRASVSPINEGQQ